MTAARVTISLAVPAGYKDGDHAQLHSNGGGIPASEIDWNNPVSSRQIPLFPGGAGIYGYGHAPYGNFAYGHPWSMRAVGYGHLPYGHFPYGHGTALLAITDRVTDCGDFIYAFAAYDKAGNAHEGTPDQAALSIHIPPNPPAGLTKATYDKATGLLTLSVDDLESSGNDGANGFIPANWPN